MTYSFRRSTGMRLWQKIVLGVALSIATLYVTLAIIHVANGFTVGDSLSMAIRDGRAITSCPFNPQEYWTFINRNDFQSVAAAFAQVAGEDIYDSVCNGTAIISLGPPRLGSDP